MLLPGNSRARHKNKRPLRGHFLTNTALALLVSVLTVGCNANICAPEYGDKTIHIPWFNTEASKIIEHETVFELPLAWGNSYCTHKHTRPSDDMMVHFDSFYDDGRRLHQFSNNNNCNGVT